MIHNIRYFQAICIISILLVSGGCLSTVQSSVARFHQLPQQGTAHTFIFIPNKEQRGSLEYASYCTLITAKLSAYGWRQNEKADSPSDYLIALNYGINDGKNVSGSIPIIGQTGGGTTQSYGTVRTNYGQTASYSGTTTTPVTIGQVGSIPFSSREYDRLLVLSIIDREKSHGEDIVKVFEARVQSSGSSGEISLIMPIMIEALFKHFPGISGKVEDVSLPLK